MATRTDRDVRLEDLVEQESGLLDVDPAACIGVDPGHFNLVAAYNGATGESMTHSNKEFRFNSGATKLQRVTERKAKSHGMYPVWATLEVTGKGWYTALFAGLDKMMEFAFLPVLRKKRLHNYGLYYSAIGKLGRQLRELVPLEARRGKIVLLWGDGCRTPALRGHAAAPNLRLRTILSTMGFVIITCPEMYTSKVTPCCRVPGDFKDGVRGWFRCYKCGQRRSRDKASAQNIHDIALSIMARRKYEMPVPFTRTSYALALGRVDQEKADIIAARIQRRRLKNARKEERKRQRVAKRDAPASGPVTSDRPCKKIK